MTPYRLGRITVIKPQVKGYRVMVQRGLCDPHRLLCTTRWFWWARLRGTWWCWAYPYGQADIQELL